MLRKLVCFLVLFPVPLFANDTIFDWDFESREPAFAYSSAFAGQGHSDCVTNIPNDGEVSADWKVTSAHAMAGLDAARWNVQPDACWTYVGWELGLGHDLKANGQQLASASLSDYLLSFDAWLAGTDALPATVTVHLQDDSTLDSSGNPTTRVVAGNNQTIDDGDLDPIILTNVRKRYAVSLDQLGFVSNSQADLTNHLENISSLNFEIEPRGVSGELGTESQQRIGTDAGNIVYLDNVQLIAPVTSIGSSRPNEPSTPVTQTLIQWDFENVQPHYAYGSSYAGQGSPDCATNIDNSAQVSLETSLSGQAEANLDTSGFTVAPDACWTYAGLEFGFGHLLHRTHQLTSADLSDYSLTFDAWIEGADELSAVVQLHMQDNSERDSDGNPVTRFSIGNNRTADDGDLNEMVFSGARQTFSMSMADLGFADIDLDGSDDFSQADIDRFFASITSMNVEIEVQGTAETIGLDTNNLLRVDNLSFSGPALVLCDSETMGDLNGDGVVNFPDFLTLSRNFGRAASSHEDGDTDCSGTVDFVDFLTLARHFGQNVSTIGGIQAVPEPGGIFLMLFSCAIAAARRRRV